jgi:hypothetical protein
MLLLSRNQKKVAQRHPTCTRLASPLQVSCFGCNRAHVRHQPLVMYAAYTSLGANASTRRSEGAVQMPFHETSQMHLTLPAWTRAVAQGTGRIQPHKA